MKVILSILLLTLTCTTSFAQKLEKQEKVKIKKTSDSWLVWNDESSVIIYSPKLKAKQKNMLRTYSFPELKLENEMELTLPTAESEVIRTYPVKEGFVVLCYGTKDKKNLLHATYISAQNPKINQWTELIEYAAMDDYFRQREFIWANTNAIRRLPGSFFYGFSGFLNQEESTLKLCIQAKGNTLHVIEFNYLSESVVLKKLPLTLSEDGAGLIHFDEMEGKYIVHIGDFDKEKVMSINDMLHVFDTKTLELQSFPLQSTLKNAPVFSSDFTYLKTHDDGFCVVAIIEDSTLFKGKHSALYRLKVKNGTTVKDTLLMDDLPENYFDFSRGKKGRKLLIEEVLFRENGNIQLVTYSQCEGEGYGHTGPQTNGSSGNSYSFQLYYSLELIVLTLDKEMQLSHQEFIPRSTSAKYETDIRVLPIQYKEEKAFMMLDLKEYYGKKGRSNEVIQPKYASNYDVTSLVIIHEDGSLSFQQLKNGRYTNNYHERLHEITPYQYLGLFSYPFHNEMFSYSLKE